MRTVVAVIALVACVQAGLWAVTRDDVNAPSFDGQLASVSYAPYDKSTDPNAGGLANITTVNTAGFQAVNSGALASGTVINNGGAQMVMDGGMTSGSIVNSGGNQNVLGTAISATVTISATTMAETKTPTVT